MFPGSTIARYSRWKMFGAKSATFSVLSNSGHDEQPVRILLVPRQVKVVYIGLDINI